MKKTLIALATLGVVGAASAQVSISGAVAFAVQNTMDDTSAEFDLSDGDINFSAKEDLGGGMSISASTSISNEGMRGNSTTANNTTIGISGGFGSIAYVNVLSGAAKMGSPSVEDDMSDVLGGYSTVNVFSYTTPELFSGFKGTLEWAANDADRMKVSGTPTFIGRYNAGPLGVYIDNGGESKVWDVRVNYDAGVAKVGVRVDKAKYQEFVATIPMGAMTYAVYAGSFENNARQASGFSATYALSKQTSLSFGYLSAKASASGINGGNGGNNYRLQLKKAF